MSLGGLAVALFFALSGLLIANSFERSPDLVRFAVARVLRLFPGLIVVLLITVLVGTMITTLEPAAFLLSPGTLAYIPRNLSLAFLQYDLPGVFADNPYPLAINGSLWTLFYEVLCYGGVLVAGVAGLLRRRWTFSVCVLVLATAYLYCLHWAPGGGVARRIDLFVTLAFPFSLGMLAYVWREVFAFNWRWALGLCGLAAISSYSPLAPLFFVVALTYATGWFGFEIKGRILRFNRVGDYSYGVYIYAFPVQQLIAYCVPGVSPLANIALSLPITLGLAILSWHLVEKRALAQIKPLANALRRLKGNAAS
jgi:peptidoglycan/LPS O-acetylase OafA/YrhL